MGGGDVVALKRIASRQYGVVGFSQALAAGFSKHMIHRRSASGEWSRLLPGVYALWPLERSRRHRQDLFAATLWLGARSAVSHRAAFELWSLDGIAAAPIELTAPTWRRPQPGPVLHRASLPARDVVVRDGIRVTSVERTLIDVGAVVSAHLVELGLESALRAGLTTLGALRARLRRISTHPGSAVLRALVSAHPGIATESPLETTFVQFVRSNGLPMPVRQHSVFSAEGRFLGRLDFAFPDARLGFELDGRRHHSTALDRTRDEVRQQAIEGQGWLVRRLGRLDLSRRARATAVELASLIIERQPEPPLPLDPDARLAEFSS